MRRKLIFLAISLLTAIGLGLAWDEKEWRSDNEQGLILASLEAMANNEYEGTGNTGPREEKKCFKGGHKMVCLSVNERDCTDSECINYRLSN